MPTFGWLGSANMLEAFFVVYFRVNLSEGVIAYPHSLKSKFGQISAKIRQSPSLLLGGEYHGSGQHRGIMLLPMEFCVPTEHENVHFGVLGYPGDTSIQIRKFVEQQTVAFAIYYKNSDTNQ